MESLSRTLPLLPNLDTKTGFVPASSGYAAIILGDCGRTPMVTLPTPPETSFRRIDVGNGAVLVFEDGTGLLEADHIYPLPLLVPGTFSKSTARDILDTTQWHQESELYHTPYGPAFTTDMLVPAWRPVHYTPTQTDKDLLDDIGKSLIYAVSPYHPIVSQCYLRWDSQPITPHKTLADPFARLHSTMPLKNRDALRAAERDIQTIIQEIASYIPPLPGQSLRDGRPKRLPVKTVSPPSMASAHDKLKAEDLPFVTLVRHTQAFLGMDA